MKVAIPVCFVCYCISSPKLFSFFFFSLLFPLNFICGIFRSLEIFQCLYSQAVDFFPLWFLPLLLCLGVPFYTRADKYSLKFSFVFFNKKKFSAFIHLEFMLVYSVKSTM